MSDQFETRIRSFVVELLDDPPTAPPFPRPGVVVIDGRTTTGSTMTDTKTRPTPMKPAPSRRRGLGIAAAAFAAIVVAIVATVALTNGDDAVPAVATTSTTVADATTTSEATTTTAADLPTADALVGARADVTGPFGSRPDVVHFEADGTYRVVDQFRTGDTGTYTIEGDVISFESGPTDEVQWAYNDAHLRVVDDCQGVVGQYSVIFTSPTAFKLEVISDACKPRLSGANNTEFEISEG